MARTSDQPKTPRPVWCRIVRSFTRISVGVVVVLGAMATWAYLTMVRMPGHSHTGALPAITAKQTELAGELERDVTWLASEVGYRHVHAATGLTAAADGLADRLKALGLAVTRDAFEVDGVTCENVIGELPGTTLSKEIVVVGAHYDSAGDIPAANDNGSGVAATLAIARRMTDDTPARTIRFALFVNEEPPYFKSAQMGSYVYATRCAERGDNIVGMLSLETIGCFSDEPGSQEYPVSMLKWMYPDAGNFIAFVGDYGSRRLVRRTIGSFRSHTAFPSVGAALPSRIPGVDWSDHWSFRQSGYPALMVTDTAPYRYPHYHRSSDTPDKLDYESCARVVEGLLYVVRDLAEE
jgi:hypothetical protein